MIWVKRRFKYADMPRARSCLEVREMKQLTLYPVAVCLPPEVAYGGERSE
jgi:hypothetical protein